MVNEASEIEGSEQVDPDAAVDDNSVFDPVKLLSNDEPWILNDNRSRSRHEWKATVEVELIEGLRHDDEQGVIRSPETNHRTIKVTTEDLSTGGFAFVHQSFIHPGTIVKVKFYMLPNKPMYLGMVRHCKNMGGMQHRIGVQFQTRPS